MTRPGGGWKRLAKLYGMVESLRAMQLRAAAGAVDEVDRAVLRMVEQRRKENREARAELAQGSRIHSMASERAGAADAARRVLMETLQVERDGQLSSALDAHRDSRMEMRQIQDLLERLRTAAEAEGVRRTQQASDDHFLSRREWMRAQEKRERE